MVRKKKSGCLSGCFTCRNLLDLCGSPPRAETSTNFHFFWNKGLAKPFHRCSKMAMTGLSWERVCTTFSFLLSLIRRSLLHRSPSGTTMLFTHSTFAFLSVRFGFCLIVTKNSTDCMKVTHMYYLFLFLYLHLQLNMKECLCRTSCRLPHSCYSFLFISTLPARGTTLPLMQWIYI